jgi:hypothetical protein
MGVTRALTSAAGAGRTEIRQSRGAGQKAFISRTEEAGHRCHGASVGPDEYPGAVLSVPRRMTRAALAAEVSAAR